MTGLNAITPNELRGQVTAIYTFARADLDDPRLVHRGLSSDNVFHGPGGVYEACDHFAGCSIPALLVRSGRKHYAAAGSAAASRSRPSP